MTESLLESTIPVEVIVRGRRCVVVGGGGEAESKVARLLEAGAAVEWFDDANAPEDPRFAGVTRLAAPPSLAELERAALVFVSTAFEELGAAAAASARVHGTLVCTLDRPEHATFVNAAVARGAGVRVAISTGGASPALAKRLREELERVLGDATLAAFVARLARARARLPRGERGALRDSAAGLHLDARWVVPPDEGS